MYIWETITGAVTFLIGYIAYNERDKSNMKQKLYTKPDTRQVERLIDTKQESLKVLQQEIKEDIHEIKTKLDKLSDKLDTK